MIECPESVHKIDKLRGDDMFAQELFAGITVLVLQQVVGKTVSVVGFEITIEIYIGPEVELNGMALGWVKCPRYNVKGHENLLDIVILLHVCLKNIYQMSLTLQLNKLQKPIVE